jgi:8-oxo-dGTP diphosphatase
VDLVIISIHEGQLSVLLTQHVEDPLGATWALPGGFVAREERLEAAAQRRLSEEIGLRQAYLEQLYTYGDPGRDPRGWVVTVAYFALVPAAGRIQADSGGDVRLAQWFPLDRLPSTVSDHSEIIEYALRRLRYKLEYTAVGFELLPSEFTLSELQRIYEIILGEEIDKRNFRRRILQSRIIEPTAGIKNGDGRPARLYRYRADAVAEVKARRLFP